jgi:DNA repair protein RecO (recombination protein O)
MKRQLKIKGFIFSTYRIQEYNRGVKLLFPELGIINAIAYGANRPKSRLASLLQSLTYGEFNIYHDPVKKIYRISDYEPLLDYSGIKEDLVKYYTALLWFEIILKSHGGGESQEDFFILLFESLTLLENCSSKKNDRLMIQFILRSIILYAGPFQLKECNNCGTIYKSGDNLYFSLRDLSFVCSNCSNNGNIIINPGAVKYIEYSSGENLEISLNSGIDDEMQLELKNILYRIIQEYLEEALVTLKSGKEFLS